MNVGTVTILLAVMVTGAIGLMVMILAGFLGDASGSARRGTSWLRGRCRFCLVPVMVRKRWRER